MKTFSNDIIYWLAALHLPGIGPVKFRRLLSLIPDIKSVFCNSEKELLYAGLNKKEVYAIKNVDWKTVEKDLHWCQKSQCQVITINDISYPTLLKEIHAPPLVLFVLGRIECLNKPQLAMVGTRHPTPTAYETAEQFSKYLASKGIIITSGLALGIDAACHWGALEVGESNAVMGTGLDLIYPASNRNLAEKVKANGALISEFSPYTLAQAKNFPLRNRIISGLSVGVIVVEAAIKSGSLITAQYALEQGREVFAIPGSIHNPSARGCHFLLKQGAKLVETAKDVLEEISSLIGISISTETSLTKYSCGKLTGLLSKIYTKIGFETTSLDTIIVRSGLTSDKVSSILLTLELEGYVRTVPGGYVRTTAW